jgi:hypothetical protein
MESVIKTYITKNVGLFCMIFVDKVREEYEIFWVHVNILQVKDTYCLHLYFCVCEGKFLFHWENDDMFILWNP